MRKTKPGPDRMTDTYDPIDDAYKSWQLAIAEMRQMVERREEDKKERAGALGSTPGPEHQRGVS